jgi:hypothetical protein
MKGPTEEFQKGETVRRTDTHRLATVIELLRPWDVYRVQLTGGQEDFIPASLLERLPAEAARRERVRPINKMECSPVPMLYESRRPR